VRDLTPEPEPTPLARAFDHIYLSADESFWRLPPLARSKETMRRAFVLSRCFRMPRLNAATHPHVQPGEYVTMAAFASASDAEIDACLADFHARYPDHPYPAALLDPAGRMGRWP
jgi:hypothetical protein